MNVTVTRTAPRAWAVTVATVGASVTATVTGPGATRAAAARLARALSQTVLQHGGTVAEATVQVTMPRLRRRLLRRAVWAATEALRVPAPAGMVVSVTRRRVEVRDGNGTVVVGGFAGSRGTVTVLVAVGRAALLMRPRETVELPEG